MPLRILFVTPYVPSPVRVRPYAFIRELARQGHQVTLVCLVQPERELKYLDEVRPYCASVFPIHIDQMEAIRGAIGSAFSRLPLSVAYCRSALLRSTVENLASKNSYDLIHTEFVRAAPSTIRLGGIPKIFDAVDSLALAYRRSMTAPYVPLKQRVIALIESVKMEQFENWVIRQYDQAIISSTRDKRELGQNTAHLEVIPNGVDLDYFSPRETVVDDYSIVFLGKLSYYVNVASVMWFYRRVFPLVKRQYPDAKLCLVGREPAPAILRLREDPSVRVVGTVPDVRPYLGDARLTICPMVSGSGIQNKLLEAMAMGRPTVATTFSCQALQVANGDEVLIADSPLEFASAVNELLGNPELQNRLSQMARRYVVTNHDWLKHGEKLTALYQAMLSKQIS
jgi:polysaccharide biosynthesis protein PslH